MSREILDCLKRKQDICIKNVIPSQNTAFMCTPALNKRNSTTSFPGSLSSASLCSWEKDPDCGWSRDHLGHKPFHRSRANEYFFVDLNWRRSLVIAMLNHRRANTPLKFSSPILSFTHANPLSTNYAYYYTFNSLTLFWLAESLQWIFEISARDFITADYTIIMSRSLKVTGYHVMYDRSAWLCQSSRALCCLPSVKKQKKILFSFMYNKTIIRFGICDIQNNQGRGKGYQPKPKAEADNPYRVQQSFFDNKNILT